MGRLIKAITIIVAAGVFLAGCSENKFNAYDHFTSIITHVSSKDYEDKQEYILSHVSDDLRDNIDNNLQGDILYPEYHIREISRVISQNGKTVDMILEFHITGSVDRTMVAYATYENDILTRYDAFQFDNSYMQ